MSGFSYALRLSVMSIFKNWIKLSFFLFFFCVSILGIKMVLILDEEVSNNTGYVYNLYEGEKIEEETFLHTKSLFDYWGQKINIYKTKSSLSYNQEYTPLILSLIVLIMLFVVFITKESKDEERIFAYKLGLSRACVLIASVLKIFILNFTFLYLFNILNLVVFVIFFIGFLMRESWA